LTIVEKTITIIVAEQTRRTRKNTIATIEFDLQRYFAAKQQKYLIMQSIIGKYTIKRFCLRANTQQ